ncbi:MAG: SAM-dependent methyltransferase [Firmicutes bacterium]|nr:SAM-dependent methyltransferase [Bacillota bacterium]
MNELTRTLLTVMNTDEAARNGDSLVRIVFADKRRKSLEYKKVTLRPVTIRSELMFQAEFHFDNKVTHKNIPYYEGVDFAEQLIREDFKQVNILTEHEDIQILAAKPDRPRITHKPADRQAASLSHDRRKHYLLEEGAPCDFLIELGVMNEDGTVRKQHYAKFRQINRFLEIADDSFRDLPEQGTLRIIDFGCGKSYLTFALYHYLKIQRGRDVEIIGLDLKEDVIRFCNGVARKLGYADLHFLTGDIADYESDGADMVVTLHACDTATDYALINAVRWNSKVILSVPCCQHELFSQIHETVNDPMLKHGILKDKFTELLTDALRGLKLEAAGYDVKMIEFTSLEHTSKNIMIKAVYDPKEAAMQKTSQDYEALKDFYHVRPTIDALE